MLRRVSTHLALAALVGAVAMAAFPARGDAEDAGHPLVVEVIGPDGRPAVDAAVTIVSARADLPVRGHGTPDVLDLPASPVPVAVGRTDREGRIRFDGLTCGSYAIVVAPTSGARTVVRQGVARGVPAAPLRVEAAAGHTLSGVARHRDGKPVAGVTIVVAPESAPWFPVHSADVTTAVTDADGAWTVTGLATDSYDVWTSRPGVAPARIATLDLETSRTIDTPIVGGGVFRATVLAAEDGAPLAGAEVRIWDISESLEGSRLGAATTDASGTCAIATGRESAAIGFVAIRCDGRMPWVTGGLGLTIADGESAARTFRVPKAVPHTGRVVGPDGPIAGARISVDVGELTPWEAEASDRVAVTDAAGEFRVDRAGGETAVVSITADGFAARSARLRRDAAGRPASEIRLDPARDATRDVIRRVRGTVRLPDRAPAPGAFVWDDTGSTVADADGSFELETASPGSRVWASIPRHVGADDDVGGKGVAGPVTITLASLPSIRGAVKSATGANVVGARVFVVQAVRDNTKSAPHPYWSTSSAARVAADGSFEIPIPSRFLAWCGFGPSTVGEYLVGVQFPGHAPAISAPIRIELPQPGEATAAKPAEPPRVDLVLEAGASLSGRVVTAAGRPVPGAAITLLAGRAYDLDSLPWPPPCLPLSRALRTTTDAAGAFTIPHLRPGRWQVTATPAAGAPVSTRIDLAAGDPAVSAPVELRLDD